MRLALSTLAMAAADFERGRDWDTTVSAKFAVAPRDAGRDSGYQLDRIINDAGEKFGPDCDDRLRRIVWNVAA